MSFEDVMQALTKVSISLLLLIYASTVACASITYIGDQGFTMSDGSGSEGGLSIAGVPEELIFRDGGPVRSGWLIHENPEQVGIYETIADESFMLAKNLSFGFEIENGLDWDTIGSSNRLASYSAEEWNFFDTEGFLGIRVFEQNLADPFYGWIRIEHDFDAGTFTVHDWAWNDTPGEPVLAGQIPEPATYAKLFGIGVLGFVVCWRAFSGRRRGNP